MKKENLIFIVGGLGLLYYYFMRKSANTMPVIKTLVPKTNDVPTQTNVEAYVYPAGLIELDLVANGVETAQLYQGQLRPLTAAYVDRYLPGSWPRTKIIPDIVYRSIPRGAVLDI
jgi:hypothetical protein